MKDYTTDDLRELINSKNKSDIQLTKHVKKRCSKRKINEEYLFDCVIDKIPLGNLKTTTNTFKLIYPDEYDNSMDLHIIVAITNNNNIRILTTYQKTRRWREHEK